MKITAKDVLMAFARAALNRIQQKYPEPTEDEMRAAAQIGYGMKRTERGFMWAVKFGDARI